MSVFYKIICKCNATSIKIPSDNFFYLESDKLIIKFIWKNKQGRITRKNIKMKSNAYVGGKGLVMSEFNPTLNL